MRAFRAGLLGSGVLLLLAGVGCQLADSDGGLHISRMIPKPELGLLDGVPPQMEPEPASAGPESSPASEEKP